LATQSSLTCNLFYGLHKNGSRWAPVFYYQVQNGYQNFIKTSYQNPSFGERITDYEAIRQAICSYAARAAEKLRGEHQFCRYISVFVKTSPFSAEPYYGNHAGSKLLTPTQDTRDIIAAATRCLDAVWRDGHRYQKAGVMLGDFFSQGVAQLNLFDENAPRANSEALMSLMDKLNQQGQGTLYFAGQGIQQSWQMKREMLSPCYTTRLEDVPAVRAC